MRLDKVRPTQMPFKASIIRAPIVSVLTVASCIIAGIVLQFLPPEIAEPIVRESGPVENASALFYAIGVAVAALQLGRIKTLPWLSGTMLLLWLLLRELDFQKMFTYRSVESIGFYTRPIAPWWQKALAILILTPFAIAGLHLFRLICQHARSALSERRSWLFYLFAIIALGIIALGSEKLFRLKLFEEICEFGVAFLALVLTLEFREKCQRTLAKKET